MKYIGFAATMQAVWFSEDEDQSWDRLPTPTGGLYNEARCWARHRLLLVLVRVFSSCHPAPPAAMISLFSGVREDGT